MRSCRARWLMWSLVPVAVAGCLFTDTDPDDEPTECSVDDDCAHLDTDDDACTTAICDYGYCKEGLVRDETCECHSADDCGALSRPCNKVSCEEHRCVEEIVPAGAAPEQVTGDCATATCDGTSAEPLEEYDEYDVPQDGNACAVGTCDPVLGAKLEYLDDGAACGEGAFCFLGFCMTCGPEDPASCGGEGPGEPHNDSGDTAATYTEHKHVCGFSDGSDIDWYTFYASDDFGFDLLEFHFWSTAPQLEVCAYVDCKSGSAGGGCSQKLPGPNGSLGCCWAGAPETLKPTWDLDCAGLDDRGTVYISVRTPGGDACETYAMKASY